MGPGINEEKLTAYLLEELDESEINSIEEDLAQDPSKAEALSDLRSAVAMSQEAFEEPSLPGVGLSEEQREEVVHTAVSQASTPPPPPSAAKKGGPSEDLFVEMPGGSLFRDTNDASDRTGASAFDLSGGLFGATSGTTNDVLSAVDKSLSPNVVNDPSVMKSTGAGAAKAGDGARSKQQKLTDDLLGNDTSALYSLANLDSLSTKKEEPAVTEATRPPKDEGSGLIDIRSLAGDLSKDEANDVDDLISMQSSTEIPQFGAPILAPQETGFRSLLKYAPWAGGAALLAIIAVGVVMLTADRDDSARQAQMEKLAVLQRQLEELKSATVSDGNDTQITELRKQIAAEEKKAVAAGADEKELAALSAPAKVEAPEETKVAAAKPAPSERSDSPSSRKKSRKSSVKRAASASSDSTKAGSGSSGDKSGLSSIFRGGSQSKSDRSSRGSAQLDDLLGAASPKRKAASRATSSTQSPKSSKKSSSKTLSRSEVRAGMKGVAGRVKKCGKGQGGTVTLSVTIGTNGRVVSANATGAHAGTPAGLCAARAVKRAKFPKFSGSSLKVKYPFQL